MASDSYLMKLAWNLPWLLRYPFWRTSEVLGRLGNGTSKGHVILFVGNHFEPGYNEEPNESGGSGIDLSPDQQLRRLEDWYKKARAIGDQVRDHDGTSFRHTNFYPIEQYDPRLLDRLADMQAEGLGEVEIHLHHGVKEPDTAENLRATLVRYRDILAEEHKCLSLGPADQVPQYAFIHGNLALANSAGGQYCGVDSELQILAETGCYADLTLPSAPDRTQVSRINALYQCGNPLDQARAHRSGPTIRIGDEPALPLIIDGPLVFDWSRRRHGLPVPKIDSGALTDKYPLTVDRFNRWRRARIGVLGRPDWIFIKLFCHGFFEYDQDATIGEKMRVFLEEVLEFSERTGEFKLHFASSREAFNMAV
ncbi:MAG TPA: hypothetical protein VJ372_14670, partial [Pyrinomonadaceae bacterium]|nr:hypothetical protein [Pyrinomonadaceae bacterium]